MGFLKEDVYVAQPPSFVDPSFPSHVCKLHVPMGLSRHLGHGFISLAYLLIRNGFRQSQAYHSLLFFIREIV